MNNIIKRLNAVLLTLALLAVLVGCGGDTIPSESSTSGVSSAADGVSSIGDGVSSAVGGTSSAAEDVSAEESSSVTVHDVTFADLPEINTDVVNVTACGDNLLLECINPGLDSFDCTVISYSVSQDKTIGSIALGGGAYSVTPNSNGGFAVLYLNSNKIAEYSPTCEKLSETTIADLISTNGIAIDADNRRLLVPVNSDLYVASYDGSNKVKVDVTADYYTPLGCAGGKFVFAAEGETLYAVGADGKATKLLSEGNVQFFNDTFAAARIRDHLAFLPLSGGENMFVKVADIEELLCGSGNNAFVTTTNVYGQSIIRVYNTLVMTCATTTVEGDVTSAAVTDSGLLIAAIGGENGYKLTSFEVSELKSKAFSATNDFMEVISATKLPEITGSAELTALTNEILDKYNVRFVCGESWLSEEASKGDFTFSFVDDDQAYLTAMRNAVDCFDFLPDKVWKNLGGDNPFVVCLCDNIEGSVSGLSTFLDVYNVIFVECTGADWFFKDVFIHEVGHAIGKVVLESNPELFDKWLETTPQKVLDAVEKGTVDGVHDITIEYTPYDPNGEIYYVSTYALTNPEEDRADTLAHLYTDCFAGKKVGLFANEVIKKKGKVWAEIIRTGFGIDGELSFEAYLK